MDLFGPRHYVSGIAYRTIGDGPALVLMHGGAGSRTHWQRNIVELSAHFRVITLDCPGFGESATPPLDMDTENYLQWVAESLQLYLANEPFHLAAFSFGSVVATRVFSGLASRTFRPRRMTLIGPAGFGQPKGRNITLEKVPSGHEVEQAEICAATARNLGRWMLWPEPAPADEAVAIHLDNVIHTHFDSRNISLGNTLIEDLGQIDTPLQILIGAKDVLAWPSPQGRLDIVRNARPDSRIELIPEAGHWLQYNACSAVNAALINFHSSEAY